MVSSLRSRIFAVSILLMLVAALVQCSGDAAKHDVAAADSLSCKKPLNPNGDSELALLMRKMMHSSQSMKEMVMKGQLPDKYPEEFKKIHTAKPTDTDTKKASFDNYANNYISQLETLYHSPKQELTTNYNSMINACAACHSEHCPGPLKAINKLKI